MENTLMELKILLPYRVFIDTKSVSRIAMETSAGYYGLLPQRLDCVAALVPGIFTYETEPGGVHYLAVDAGVMVKAGTQVLVSVRNAYGGADLGKLGEMVKTAFQHEDEGEKQARVVMGKLEGAFIYGVDKFNKI